MCLGTKHPHVRSTEERTHERLMDRKKKQSEKYYRRVEKRKTRVHWMFYTVNFTFTIINSGFMRD